MEGAFRAIECRLAQMNVFSHYCLTFSANDCVSSLNEQQKVQYICLPVNKFLFYFQSKPFRNNIATPLAFLLPWASFKGAQPRSAFHFSVPIFAFCFRQHAKIGRRFLKLLKPLTFKDNILKSQDTHQSRI